MSRNRFPWPAIGYMRDRIRTNKRDSFRPVTRLDALATCDGKRSCNGVSFTTTGGVGFKPVAIPGSPTQDF